MVVCVRDEESLLIVLPSHELECCVLAATVLPKKCVPLTSTACCCFDELLLLLSMLAPSADTPVEDFGVGANPRPGRHSLAFKDNSFTESAISSIFFFVDAYSLFSVISW